MVGNVVLAITSQGGPEPYPHPYPEGIGAEWRGRFRVLERKEGRMSGPRILAAASGLVVALAAVPLAPIHAQGQISQLSQDSKLIFQMASSNIMEVRLGQMAQQKATNAAVKQFGQQMATDHTNLENQLTGLVSKNGTNFQPGMSKESEAEVSRLEKLSG